MLFSGLYSNKGASFKILKLVDEEKIRPVLSNTLLLEYEDILKKKRTVLGFTESEIEEVLNNLCALSVKQLIYFLWRPKLKDPKDDHVLELAFASQCDALVTHNLKDFVGSDDLGIRVLRPSELLKELI